MSGFRIAGWVVGQSRQHITHKRLKMGQHDKLINFITIPPGLDCRELGRRPTEPVPEKTQNGMKFGDIANTLDLDDDEKGLPHD